MSDGDVKFGTGGFRGIIGDTFTKSNIQRICQAIANIVDREKLKKQIYIGYDNRFMSEDFAGYCAEVFLANDFKVSLTKKSCSTPVVMYKTMMERNDYGVMITASHNPHIYNGIKVFVARGKDAGLEDTNKIEKEFNALTEVKAVELKYYKGDNLAMVDDRINFVNSIVWNQHIPKLNNLRVVFDNKNGSTAREIDILCGKLGIKDYKIINRHRDAFFGFTTPAPNSENLTALKNEILNNHYDIGFAVDADGDRLAIIDEKGNFVDNNEILALVYYYLVKYENRKGGIVKNVATSALIDAVAKQLGYPCFEVPVGFKYVSGKLLEEHAVVGGESSGGLAVANHILGKDSMLSIALCLKIMHTIGKPFSEIIKELLEFAGNFNMTILDKSYSYSLETEAKVKEKLFVNKELPTLTKPVSKIVTTDYVKVYYTDGSWALIRFSGTEPIVRIFVEDYSVEACENEITLWQKFLGL